MGTRFLLFVAGAALTMGQSSSSLVSPSESAGLVAPTQSTYEPISAKGRVQWIVSSTVGPATLIAGVFTEALSTRSNSPEEYGTHWDGFGKRYGLRLTGQATSSLMEASLGSLWGEDPRYFRTSGQPLRNRLDHVVRMAFLSHDRAGHEMPAYARYIALPGSAFLSNTWRPDSQTHLSGAFGLISFNLVSRVIGNAFAEFGPDLRKRFSKKKDPDSGK